MIYCGDNSVTRGDIVEVRGIHCLFIILATKTYVRKHLCYHKVKAIITKENCFSFFDQIENIEDQTISKTHGKLLENYI